MKYYLIAGEASGDLHGANLARALKKADPAARFRFWGGDEMAAILGPPRKHIKDLAFMGFWEVVKNLPAILGNFRFCRADIRDFQPDVLILIDYPGFNLRMAKWAKKAGIRVFYYISPQLWAWHSSRAKTVRDCVDEMFVILPFEKDFYKKYDLDVHFVGHPLLDETEHFRASERLRLFDPTAPFSEVAAADTPKEKRIALLPGSRRQEIRNMLPVMLEVAMQFPDYQFVVAEAPAMDSAVYARIFNAFFARHGQISHIKTTRNQTRLLLAHSTAALVTSGTATLETALFEVPQVVCYKGNGLSFWLARRLVNVSFISLVNLIAGRELVRELIQSDFHARLLSAELSKLLQPEVREKMKAGYREVKARLGGSGASERAANKMVARLSEIIGA